MKRIEAFEHGTAYKMVPQLPLHAACNPLINVVTAGTSEQERKEAAAHAHTIQAMREDRWLGLRCSPLDYNGSPGWWRAQVRRRIADAHNPMGLHHGSIIVDAPYRAALWNRVY